MLSLITLVALDIVMQQHYATQQKARDSESLAQVVLSIRGIEWVSAQVEYLKNNPPKSYCSI